MHKIDQLVLPIKLTVHWPLQAIYLLGFVLFTCMAIVSWFFTQVIALSLCSGVFAVFCVYTFFLSRSTIQIDRQSLMVTAPHGIYKIDWDEVEIIETNNVAFAFLGKNKCLSMNLTTVGNGKREFCEFLNQIIVDRQIQVNPLTTIWFFQKNTKIRGFGLRL